MSLMAAMIGRLLLGTLFILSGIQKLSAPAATAAYFEEVSSLPGVLAIPVGMFELVAGALLAIGLMTRLAAISLAIFTTLTIILAHSEIADPAQGAQALKNLAIIGGLLMAFSYAHVRAGADIIELDRRSEIASYAATHPASPPGNPPYPPETFASPTPSPYPHQRSTMPAKGPADMLVRRGVEVYDCTLETVSWCAWWRY